MKLGVNIDHVATVREARGGKDPDPLFAASVCEKAGADSIVAHLREDRRHIKDKDIFLLRKAVKTRFNLEMSTFPDIVKIACEVKPHQATLVPEKREEVTTEGGLNVAGYTDKIRRVVRTLKKDNIEVSLFIDPDKRHIDASVKAGVDRIELHTGRYANALNARRKQYFLDQIKAAAVYARSKGLLVFAGHGLDYKNVGKIVGIAEIEELNIGYSIVCRAVFVGLEKAVLEMKTLINQ